MRWITSKPAVGSMMLCAALALTSNHARAAEISVQNDRLQDGGTAAIQVGFVAGETAAAWLTSPCDGTIVAVQVFWRSSNGAAPVEIHDSVTVRAGGNFPTPGPILNSNGVPTNLIGPAMQDGGLNEFRFIDENNTIPIDIPVSEGEEFVVTFTFAENPGPQGPSLGTDVNGCGNDVNSIDEIILGWIDICAIFPISGDFVIRAIVDCGTLGACCIDSGECIPNTEPADCKSMGGIFVGDGVTCAQVSCPQPGACCMIDGTCQDDLIAEDCVNLGGSYQGDDSECADVECEQPTGACCFMPDGCVNLTNADCTLADGTWGGPGTQCSSFDCFPEGACCLPDGSCFEGSPTDCADAGGTYQDNDTLCSSVECPLPTGACCLNNGNCLLLTEADCTVVPNSSWAGPLTTCADDNGNELADACEAPNDCTGDLVDSKTFQPPPDGLVDGADLAFLLGEWGDVSGRGSPADMVTSKTFEPPPDGLVDGADLAVLLGAWGACP